MENNRKGAADLYQSPPGQAIASGRFRQCGCERIGCVSYSRRIGVSQELGRCPGHRALRDELHDGHPENAVDSSYAICNLASERRAPRRGSVLFTPRRPRVLSPLLLPARIDYVCGRRTFRAESKHSRLLRSHARGHSSVRKHDRRPIAIATVAAIGPGRIWQLIDELADSSAGKFKLLFCDSELFRESTGELFRFRTVKRPVGCATDAGSA